VAQIEGLVMESDIKQMNQDGKKSKNWSAASEK
jgi:hypothetical protein